MIHLFMPRLVQERAIAVEEVDAALTRVLDGPEFRRERTLLDEMIEWLGANFGTEAVELLGPLTRWIFAAALVGALLWSALVLVRALRSQGAGAAAGPARTSPLERARALLVRAREARSSGDLRLALRLYLHALLLGTSQAGELVYRDAWTNRELLRLGEPSPRVRTLLDAIVREYEPKEFGRAEVATGDLERLEELVATHLPAVQPANGGAA